MTSRDSAPFPSLFYIVIIAIYIYIPVMRGVGMKQQQRQQQQHTHTHTEKEFSMVRETVKIFCRGSAGTVTDPKKIDRITYQIFKEICQQRYTGEAA